MDQILKNTDKKIFVYNVSDERELFAANEKTETEVASLTKIMTVWTFLSGEKSKKLSEKITITEEMLQNLNEFVTINLYAGQEVTLEDLIFAAMLPSAGDAAQALAVYDAGSVEKFVEKMNKKVSELGLFHTKFSNVVGFDEENYSSAEDMAVILKNALKNKKFYEVISTFEKYLPSLDVVVKKTFDKGEFFLGGKTGFTFEAGRNLASFSEINGAEIIVVNLNEDYMTNDHVENSEKIYQYLKENFSYQKILKTGDMIKNIPVRDSSTKNLEILAETDIEKFLENNFDISSLSYNYDGVEEITRDIKFGDLLGKYSVKNGEEIFYEQEIYLQTEIEFYPYWLWNTIIGTIFGAAIIFFIVKHRKNTCRARRRSF